MLDCVYFFLCEGTGRPDELEPGIFLDVFWIGLTSCSDVVRGFERFMYKPGQLEFWARLTIDNVAPSLQVRKEGPQCIQAVADACRAKTLRSITKLKIFGIGWQDQVTTERLAGVCDILVCQRFCPLIRFADGLSTVRIALGTGTRSSSGDNVFTVQFGISVAQNRVQVRHMVKV
jgi:hypothetical protein